MPIVTTKTNAISNEIVTLAEAKEQPPLRIDHNLDDSLVTRLIYQAREEAESYSHRTLRLSVTREETFDGWPDKIKFDHPPLEAVTAVKYYDTNDVEQTLAASNYTVQIPSEGRGLLTWSRAAGTTLPSLTDRIDSVTVEYTTGYTTAAAAPEQAKGAILLLVSAWYDPEDLNEAAAYRETAKMVLNNIDWGNYE